MGALAWGHSHICMDTFAWMHSHVGSGGAPCRHTMDTSARDVGYHWQRGSPGCMPDPTAPSPVRQPRGDFFNGVPMRFYGGTLPCYLAAHGLKRSSATAPPLTSPAPLVPPLTYTLTHFPLLTPALSLMHAPFHTLSLSPCLSPCLSLAHARTPARPHARTPTTHTPIAHHGPLHDPLHCPSQFPRSHCQQSSAACCSQAAALPPSQSFR